MGVQRKLRRNKISKQCGVVLEFAVLRLTNFPYYQLRLSKVDKLVTRGSTVTGLFYFDVGAAIVTKVKQITKVTNEIGIPALDNITFKPCLDQITH